MTSEDLATPCPLVIAQMMGVPAADRPHVQKAGGEAPHIGGVSTTG
jgi:hypothetical protein